MVVVRKKFSLMEFLLISMSRPFSVSHWSNDDSLPGYIAPKKPYGFEAMQNDILTFASRTLVTDGRLCMWMPTSNDEVELVIPMHPDLEIVNVSVQPFNNCMFSLSPASCGLCPLTSSGSRRLITYRRLPEGQVSDVSLARQKDDAQGTYADDLNSFRRKVSNPLGSLESISNRPSTSPKTKRSSPKSKRSLTTNRYHQLHRHSNKS